MVERLKIKGLQSHYDSGFVFSEGVNIITGSSCAGKSAILRALRMVIENKPSGINFISHGEKELNVTLKYCGNTIQRVKSKKDNYYVLNDEVYKGFGVNVPEKIADVLNMNDINIQRQFDEPFLISNSGGEISKYMNKVIDLDEIDNALLTAENDKRKSKKDFEVLKENIELKKNEIEKYKGIDDLKKRIDCVYKDLSHVNDLKAKIEDLPEIINSYSTVNKELRKYKDIDITGKLLDKSESKINRLIELDGQINELRSTVDTISFIEDKMKSFICIDKHSSEVDILLSRANKIDDDRKTIVALKNSVKDYETHELNTIKLNSIITKNNKLLKEKVIEKCPLCGK